MIKKSLNGHFTGIGLHISLFNNFRLIILSLDRLGFSKWYQSVTCFRIGVLRSVGEFQFFHEFKSIHTHTQFFGILCRFKTILGKISTTYPVRKNFNNISCKEKGNLTSKRSGHYTEYHWYNFLI